MIRLNGREMREKLNAILESCQSDEDRSEGKNTDKKLSSSKNA